MMKIAFAFLWLIRFLPIGGLHAIAFVLGRMAYYLARERRRVGLTNLRLCFPNKTESERKTIIKANFVYMLQLVLEYGVVWWSRPERLKKLVKINNLETLLKLREQGEDVILFYPHFVGFEMCALALNLYSPLVSVYSHQKNPDLDAQIYQGRMRFDNAYIVSRQESLRSIIKAMRKDHAPFLYLPDQDFGPKDSIFVPFFGVQAATIGGLSRISALAKAKVVPVIAKRIGNHFELDIYPAWDNFPTDDVYQDTLRMNQFLEARVKEHPEQYFWLHKRFKTRPEGEARFYK